MKDYHINVFFSEDDNGYIADIPDLFSCSAFGETPEVALSEVLKAKTAWIASALANGIAIPNPVYRPAIYQVS
jgi:predicted RNase H-like HicB family nuclease